LTKKGYQQRRKTMEIFISLLVVIVATGCFAAILAADWSERRKRRVALVTAKRSDGTSNQRLKIQ
jgi:hypothetical protein